MKNEVPHEKKLMENWFFTSVLVPKARSGHLQESARTVPTLALSILPPIPSTSVDGPFLPRSFSIRPKS